MAKVVVNRVSQGGINVAKMSGRITGVDAYILKSANDGLSWLIGVGINENTKTE